MYHASVTETTKNFTIPCHMLVATMPCGIWDVVKFGPLPLRACFSNLYIDILICVLVQMLIKHYHTVQ